MAGLAGRQRTAHSARQPHPCLLRSRVSRVSLPDCTLWTILVHRFLFVFLGPLLVIASLALLTFLRLQKAKKSGVAPKPSVVVPAQQKKKRRLSLDSTLAAEMSHASHPGSKRDDVMNDFWKYSSIVAFVVYPQVCTTTFTMLRDCHELLDGSKWLRADYRIACDERLTVLATVSLVIYAFGVPLAYLYLLWRERHNLFTEASDQNKVQYVRRARAPAVGQREVMGDALTPAYIVAPLALSAPPARVLLRV